MTSSSVSQRPTQWMCREEASQRSLMNGLFKTIFPLKLSYQLKTLSPGRMAWTSSPRTLDQLMCKAKACTVSTMNSLFKTIFPLNVLYWFQVSSPGRSAQQMYIAEASPVSPTNGLFKTFFQVKLSAQRLCLWGDLNNECAEESLPQCHQRTVFSRPSS